MMAESIARERYEIEVREKAQRKVFILFFLIFQPYAFRRLDNGTRTKYDDLSTSRHSWMSVKMVKFP